MNTYLLNEEHEFSGYWWLPGSGNKIHGVLRFNKNSLDLELDGSLQKPKKELTEYNPNIKYSKIYGECKGKFLTFIDAKCWGASVNICSSYSITEKIKGSYLIVGSHVVNELLKTMTFYTPELQSFMCHLVLKKIIQTSPEVKINFELSKNKKLNFQVPTIESSIDIDFVWKESGNDYKKRIIETGAAFTIKPDSPQKIKWFLEQRKKVTMWLTFLSGYGMSPLSIDCSGENEDLNFIVALPDQNYCSVNHPTDFFINKNSITNNFEVLLNNWFDLFESHPNFRIPCALAFEILSEKITSAHLVDFLNLMQALEGIHRAFYDGIYMEQKEYDKVVYTKTFKAIPIVVAADHRASLKSRLKFGNEISLNKRLNELANEFDNEIKKIIFREEKKVPRCWVETRNYFTHRDEGTKDNVLEGADLYEAIVRLRAFLRLTILRLMGVPQDLLIDALSNSSHFSRELKQFSGSV